MEYGKLTSHYCFPTGSVFWGNLLLYILIITKPSGILSSKKILVPLICYFLELELQYEFIWLLCKGQFCSANVLLITIINSWRQPWMLALADGILLLIGVELKNRSRNYISNILGLFLRSLMRNSTGSPRLQILCSHVVTFICA